MYDLNEILNSELDKDKLKFLIKLEKSEDIEKLYQKAYEIKLKYVGNKVYFRGIIEISNICIKNCFYCGIRKSNKEITRYQMTEEEILEAAKWAYNNFYGSVVLQAGERQDEEYITFIENIIKKIKKLSNNKLGITLSLGEQEKETYKRWFDAGAHRYLLRIETSNKELYKKLHPEDHSFDFRLNCLKNLKEIGYQTGTGVMIGLPYQTDEDLVNDIIFFKDMDIDMIGMGPYVVHQNTPLADKVTEYDKDKQLTKALKMIALCRIYLKDINIASTTALQALKHDGREMGLKAGANIIMPVITDLKYRSYYKLYEDKPCLDENAEMCKNCLQERINSIGEIIAFNEWGDPPHYKNKKINN